MAAGGFKEFVAGEVLDEDEINDFLMQGVLVFAGTAARGSAITSPVEGQFAWLNDSDQLTYHDGSDWVELSTTPGAAVISATTGSPTTASADGYTYYAFTGDGSITFSGAGFVDVLVVGGGGGGSQDIDRATDSGGGGGAGGALLVENFFVASGTVTVTVGSGGVGSTAATSVQTATGKNGVASIFGALVGVGGGFGGCTASLQGVPASGGSGGGGGGAASNVGAAGVPGQGNAGGDGALLEGGGGGGGAGAVGGNGVSPDTGGAGGVGTSAASAWGIATSLGEDVGGVHYFAGGGGGGGDVTGGTGGDGGGGAGGGQTGAGSAGDANTGGGGGGSEGGLSGAGGSGVVIVRVG